MIISTAFRILQCLQFLQEIVIFISAIIIINIETEFITHHIL